THLLQRLLRQCEQTADPYLRELLDERRAYPVPCTDTVTEGANAVAVPLRLITREGVLSLLSATMIFGTPLDVTLSELALETFLPADTATAAVLRRLTADGCWTIRAAAKSRCVHVHAYLLQSHLKNTACI